jgi:hypothetical protein
LTLKTIYDSGAGPALTAIGATDKLWWQAAGAFAYGAGGAILITEYNGGFHIIDASNAELCDTGHAVNLKYIDTDSVQIAGGSTVDLSTVTTAQCLNLLISCDPNAEVTAASFFCYGAAEADPPAGLTVKGFEQGDTDWSDVGGSAAAKALGTSESAAAHNFYFGLSVSPTSNGAKTGTLKLSATVV